MSIADVIRTVAFPGLGTGVGQIGSATCAHQVRRAIEDALLDAGLFPVSWADAQRQHQRLYTDQVRDLQRG